MKQKDYYALLGVNKRSSKEEIKQNYRRLAKKYHPDANVGSPEMEEVFKELTIAYDTLTDKDKKRKYDKLVARYGYGVPKKDASKKYAVKNSDTAGEIINTLLGFSKNAKETILAKATDIKVIVNSKKQAKKGSNIESNLEITLEEGFFGTDKKLSLKNVGDGSSSYTIQVPKGIKDGEKIRLAALGKPGKNGGKNGDLIITVKLKAEPEFRLEGTDIHKDIDVSYAQAIIGDKISIKIFGEQVDVVIPSGIKDKDRIVLENKGYIKGEARGKLILNIHVKQPDEITERERKIYEQLLRVEKQQKQEKTKNK